MPEVVHLLAEERVRIGVAKFQPACGKPHQSGDGTQKRRLAGPIWPGQHQGLPGGDRKADPGENLAATANAGEIAAGKLDRHHVRHPPRLQPQTAEISTTSASRAGYMTIVCVAGDWKSTYKAAHCSRRLDVRLGHQGFTSAWYHTATLAAASRSPE